MPRMDFRWQTSRLPFWAALSFLYGRFACLYFVIGAIGELAICIVFLGRRSLQKDRKNQGLLAYLGIHMDVSVATVTDRLK